MENVVYAPVYVCSVRWGISDANNELVKYNHAFELTVKFVDQLG